MEHIVQERTSSSRRARIAVSLAPHTLCLVVNTHSVASTMLICSLCNEDGAHVRLALRLFRDCSMVFRGMATHPGPLPRFATQPTTIRGEINS